jgi:hypothetical protein
MGITGNCAKFLLYSRQRGARFTTTLMLGRQQLFIKDAEQEELRSKFDLPAKDLPSHGFAEPFFAMLGANVMDSVDYSDFEKASIIHDLNRPVPASMKGKYSVVFDGGTLEHVFNFPVAIKNCMDLLHVGGHFISITPTNNFCGHGFYQFSPELFFALFNEHHGFTVKLVTMGVEHPVKGITEWFEVIHPQQVRRRVTLCNSNPTSLMIIAEKKKETDGLEVQPFQSDYAHIWTIHDSIQHDVPLQEESRWIHHFRRWAPDFIKNRIRAIRDRNLDQQEQVQGLGLVNPLFFTKMDI